MRRTPFKNIMFKILHSKIYVNNFFEIQINNSLTFQKHLFKTRGIYSYHQEENNLRKRRKKNVSFIKSNGIGIGNYI